MLNQKAERIFDSKDKNKYTRTWVRRVTINLVGKDTKYSDNKRDFMCGSKIGAWNKYKLETWLENSGTVWLLLRRWFNFLENTHILRMRHVLARFRARKQLRRHTSKYIIMLKINSLGRWIHAGKQSSSFGVTYVFKIFSFLAILKSKR